LLLPVFALAAAIPLRAEVFELWPWKPGGVSAPGSLVERLPGKVKELHAEKIRVNGVPLEIRVSAVDADFATILTVLAKLFRPENLAAGPDAVRVAYKLGKDRVERWLLVNGGRGKPATLFVIVSPEKLPQPESWPAELPPLPPGAAAKQVVQFPERKAVYGSFQNAGRDPENLAKELTGRLRAEGWIPLGNETEQPGGGRGGIYLSRNPRRLLWAGYGADGSGIFYLRPY